MATRQSSTRTQSTSGRTLRSNSYYLQDFSSSMKFDGGTTYVDVPDAPSLNSVGSLTLAGWINPANNSCRIFSKDNSGGAAREFIVKIDGSNRIEFDIFSGTTLKQNLGGTITQNVYQHIACTYDGTNMINYLNGSNVKQTATSGTIANKATDLIFGRNLTGTEWFKGTLDNLSMYNRALSATEVNTLYHTNTAGSPTGFWKFDETKNAIAVDSSGNGNHGAIIGGSYVFSPPIAKRIFVNQSDVYIQDNFIDGDSTSIASHTPNIGTSTWSQTAATSFYIQSDALQANRKTDGDLAIIDAGTSNLIISANLTSVSDGTNVGAPGIVFRYTDTNNYWYAYIDSKNNFVDVFNVSGGVSTLMINQQMTITSNTAYTIKVACYQSNITLYVNNVEIVTVVNSNNSTATKVGIRYGGIASGNTAIYSNFLVKKFTGIVFDWPVFTEYVGNPVVPLGSAGAWDSTDVNNPNVIFDPNNNVYQLYYSGYGTTADNVQNMGLAEATNLLGPWTKNGTNPVMLANGTDGIYAFNGGLIYWNNLWYNYYCSNNATKIRVATSPDLVNWTRVQIALDVGTAGAWDSGGVFDGFSRIRANGSTIELWYAAKDSGNTKRGIGYATSTDGLNFTRYAYNPVLNTPSWINVFANLGEPSIYVPDNQEGTQILMNFDSATTSGKRFISQALSIDGGLTWHYRVGALLKGTGWESNQVFDSYLMKNNGTMYLFHSGANVDGGALNLNIQLGVATYTPLSGTTLIANTIA